MLRIASQCFTLRLYVLSFSKVRPASLGRDVTLCLEACGCDARVIVEEHRRYLQKVCRMSRQDAFDRLYHDKNESVTEERSTSWSYNRYISTFLEMLPAGFDPEQHPLLEVILRQKEKALERARENFHVRGCWSARGHPEPGTDAQLHTKLVNRFF